MMNKTKSEKYPIITDMGNGQIRIETDKYIQYTSEEDYYKQIKND